jgi:hypothetical protein
VLQRLRQVRSGRRGTALAGLAAVLAVGAAVVLGGDLGATGAGSAAQAPSVRPAPARPGGFAIPDDAARAAAPSTATSEAAQAPAPPPGVPPIGTVDRTLVRTAQVELEVADPAAAGRRVRTAVAAAGGFVTEEQSGTRGALLVVRVPAAALDRLLDDVGTVGKVLERTAQTVDVTEEVVDLDARVASAQASVARVRALLARAESIGEVVAIESELARREADLDSLTARLTALRGQAALSTLTIDLRPVGTTAADDRALGFLDGLGAGWDGLRAVGLAAAVVVGFVLPFLPLLGLFAGGAWLVRRAARGRREPAPPV